MVLSRHVFAVKWLILILGILSSASASVLIKIAATPPNVLPSLRDPLPGLGNLALWFGIVLYGVAFFLYLASLSRFPLIVAQPILTGGAIALVALAAVFVFGEPATRTSVGGVCFIIAGIVLLAK